jgi:hypothetical protein
MSDTLPHYAKVETVPYSGDRDTDFEPTVRFECPWKYGACHFYPTCDCEQLSEDHYQEHGPGHERVWHEECWMQGWFDNGGTQYEGEDYDDTNDSCLPNGMNREGRITTSWEMDFVAWEFTA